MPSPPWASETIKLIAKSPRWRLTCLVSAVTAILGLHASSALALSLGRVTVLSSLGEPLRAEVDILDINAEETESLNVRVATPEIYAAAGVEFNAAMLGLQASLVRRADGRPYLRITGERNVSDPFVDMILVSNWASGRIVRNYTMLLDPPLSKQTSPTLPQAPAFTPVQPQSGAAVGVTETPGAAPANASTNDTPSPATPAPTTPAANTPAPPAPASNRPPATAAATAATGPQITVKAGDTAAKLAEQNRMRGVSLDQMLVAMLNSNPDAFQRGNLNRLKAGAVLSMPSAEAANAIAPERASQVVIAQSKDFNEFRRSLASNAPKAAVGTANQKASGQITAKVEDKKASASAPDKLTLSKGALQSKAKEEKIAKDLAAKDERARAAELAKNIEELNKLNANSTAKASPAAPNTTGAASSPTPPPIPTIAVPTPPVVPASAAAKPASAPAAPSVAANDPAAEDGMSWMDDMLDNPIAQAAAGGGVIAALAGLLVYMRRRKKQGAAAESSFMDSRLQPDSSFFGTSGGQRVDTGDEGPHSVSSMVYSASQLEAADNVDAIAEADVYLAYGRDQQAEDILKDALRYTPERLAIYSKLAEIYGKRNDAASLKECAVTAYELCAGQGPEWASICKVGQFVDPQDALYQSGPADNAAPAASEATAGAFNTPTPAASSAAPSPGKIAPSAMGIDLDLDLDLDTENTAASAAPTPTPPPAATAPANTGNSEMMEFDLGGLSLDLDANAPADADAEADIDPNSPLATKLALAEEFIGMGDPEGARGLIEEVIAEASGAMRTKAQRALDRLG